MNFLNHQPAYIKKLEYQKGNSKCFVVEGNVHDIYPIYSSGNNTDYEGINELIYSVFDSGDTADKYQFLFCNPLTGFADPLHLNATEGIISQCDKLIAEAKDEERRMNNIRSKKDDDEVPFIRVARRIQQALTKRLTPQDGQEAKSVVVVMDYASRYLISSEVHDMDEQTFFMLLLDGIKNAIRCNAYVNTLVLVVEKATDLPVWFIQNNPHVCVLSIPDPDSSVRNLYLKNCFSEFDSLYTMTESNTDEMKELFKKVVNATEGMKLVGIDNIRRLYREKGAKINELPDIISVYRYGFKENAWISLKENIRGDFTYKIENRVKGQPQVVRKVNKILKRAVNGMSGIQHSMGSSNKPRGIILCVGPTGTGKTELAKTISDILFGENKIIRFDLGEYTEEASVLKLVGAPPGYVGYQDGGLLTNAVKHNPMSIILFDEVEKAHPRVYDSLLQVVEDGRLTDSFGCTVSFANTIIIFTSNAGMTSVHTNPITGETVRIENVCPSDSLEDIKVAAMKGLRAAMKPEFINKLGKNILIFNYIDEENTRDIISSKIKNINMLVNKNQKIEISLNELAVYDLLYKLSWTDDVRKYGGRGIVNIIEDIYVNTLSEYIFDHECGEGCKLHGDVSHDEIIFMEV